MNWFKKASLESTLPYFEEFKDYGQYQPNIESLNKRLESMGLKVVNDIGSGDSGVAYLLSNGDVLKITTNAQEGRVAMHFLENPNPNIVEYKNIWKEGDLYYIIMENLTEMAKDDSELRSIFDYIEKIFRIKNITNIYGAYSTIETNRVIPMKYKTILLNYLYSLRGVPINLFDFININNVGVKNGALKFFDIT